MKSADTYTRGLRFVRLFRLLNGEMPMQQADMLLTIARKPGIGMAELEQQLQMAQSSISRNIAALSRFQRLDEPGLDLIEAQIDPRAPKKRIFFLTPKGKQFVTRLLKVMDEKFSIDAETDARAAIEQMHEEMVREHVPSGRGAPLAKLVP